MSLSLTLTHRVQCNYYIFECLRVYESAGKVTNHVSRQSNSYTDGNIFENVRHVFLGLLIKYIHQEGFLQMKIVVHVCNPAPRTGGQEHHPFKDSFTYIMNRRLTWDFLRLAFEIKAKKKSKLTQKKKLTIIFMYIDL